MPHKSRVQSMVNHADATSEGGVKKSGTVSSSDFPSIPHSILKSRTTKLYLMSATTGNVVALPIPLN